MSTYEFRFPRLAANWAAKRSTDQVGATAVQHNRATSARRDAFRTARTVVTEGYKDETGDVPTVSAGFRRSSQVGAVFNRVPEWLWTIAALPVALLLVDIVVRRWGLIS